MRVPMLAFTVLGPALALACSSSDGDDGNANDDPGTASGEVASSSGAVGASSSGGPATSSGGGSSGAHGSSGATSSGSSSSSGAVGASSSGASGASGSSGASSSSGGATSSSSSSSGDPPPPPATHTDGVKNGDETGVDCGGPTAELRCPVGEGCAAGSDCGSVACAYDGRCVAAKSCVRHEGGDTCGQGETYDAVHHHESCCETIPVAAAGGVKLDKYNVTAGRMRAFVEDTGANVREYISAHTPAWWVSDWTNYLPTGNDTPQVQVQTKVRDLGVYGQLGPAFVYDQAGEAGCWSGASDGEAGAPTYWIPTANRAALESEDVGSRYPQEMLDQKPLNCVNVPMLAAFCAWDGGRLPTIAELDAAWNGDGAARTYPWGDAPDPAGYTNGYPSAAALTPANGDPLRANFRRNYPMTDPDWNATQAAFGLPTKGVQGNDLAFYIAPPGRFHSGAGPYGHEDLAGAVFDVTSTFYTSQTETLQMQSRWSRSGSWETAHQIPYETFIGPVLRKYWAQGGRCVKN